MAKKNEYLSPEQFEKQTEKELEEIKQGIFKLLEQYYEVAKMFEGNKRDRRWLNGTDDHGGDRKGYGDPGAGPEGDGSEG